MNHISRGSRRDNTQPYCEGALIYCVGLDGEKVYETTDERDCALFAAQLRAYINALGAMRPPEPDRQKIEELRGMNRDAWRERLAAAYNRRLHEADCTQAACWGAVADEAMKMCDAEKERR